MTVEGKYKQSFEIEYELKSPEVLYFDNEPKITIDVKYNKKQIRAYQKGFKETAKYLKKMKRLGFTLVEQERGENGT